MVQISEETELCSMLKCATKAKSVREIHARIMVTGASHNIYTCNNLMNAYTNVGLISASRSLFDSIPFKSKNVVSWTLLISGYIKSRLYPRALSSFSQMLSSGLQPNHFTFSTIFPAFAILGNLLFAKAAHALWLRRSYNRNLIVDTCLVNMYSLFGCMPSAHHVFDHMPLPTLASWNVLISGYARNAMPAQSLLLFNSMRLHLRSLDHFTFMSLISAASTPTFDAITSSAIHALILKSGYQKDQQLQTALIKMYTSCSFIPQAHRVFCEMPVRDVVAWTLMLQGFSSSQQWSNAIQHFSEMMSVHARFIDSAALLSILSSCSGSGALLHGRWVHAFILKHGFNNDVFVGSAVIDMYTSCGDFDSGIRYFDTMDEKDVACWNALIKAMGANGDGKYAVDLLWRMETSGLKPNASTLISVLCACSHAGMIDEGLWIFRHMTERWGVIPNSQHYACLVDLLARSGRLDEAHSAMHQMPMQAHIGAYGALLSACKLYGNTEMGVDIFQKLLKLDHKDAGHFCSVMNMYASVGDWEGVAMSNVALRQEGGKKEPGYSLIESSRQVSAS